VKGYQGFAIGVLAALVLSGCREDGERPISTDTFIEVQVALRAAGGADGLDEATRARVLEEHGVTDLELRAYLRAHEERPERLRAVYDEIARRTQPEAPAAEEPLEAAPVVAAEEVDTLSEPEVPSEAEAAPRPGPAPARTPGVPARRPPPSVPD
jgi:hypothetical protein